MPGEVTGGTQEPRGDIAGEACGFSVERCQVFAQFAIVIVHGKERIGQGPWAGGRDAEVAKGPGSDGVEDAGDRSDGARVCGMLIGFEGERREKGAIPMGGNFTHENRKRGGEGGLGRGEATFEGGAGAFLEVGHAAFAAQGCMRKTEEELGSGADENVQVGGEILGSFEGFEAISDKVLGERERRGEAGVEGQASSAETVETILDGG